VAAARRGQFLEPVGLPHVPRDAGRAVLLQAEGAPECDWRIWLRREFFQLPDWLAWECFGEGNGAATLEAFRRRLDNLRERNRLGGTGGLSQIVCIVLVQAVFFPPEEWIPQPADWATRNLRYTRYDLTVVCRSTQPPSSGSGARVRQVLNTALMTALSGMALSEARRDREFWGRLVESAVGAHLANAASAGECEVFYLPDRDAEVDFVVRAGKGGHGHRSEEQARARGSRAWPPSELRCQRRGSWWSAQTACLLRISCAGP
jgi:hypothetical protein